jgi:hypothetical protein
MSQAVGGRVEKDRITPVSGNRWTTMLQAVQNQVGGNNGEVCPLSKAGCATYWLSNVSASFE